MRKRADTHKNVALGILLGIVLVAGLVFGALVLFAPKDDTPIDDNEDTSSVEQAADREDEEPADTDPEQPNDDENGKTKLNVGLDTDYSGGAIEAFSTIYGTVDTSGKCVFTFTSPDGLAVSVETEALQGPSTVTCARAEYKTSVPGKWTVVLKYETSNELGEGRASVIVE